MFPKLGTKSFSKLLMQLPLILFLVMLPGIIQAASQQARIALESNPALAYAPDSVLIRFKPGTVHAQKQQARNLVGGNMMRGFGIVNALEHLQLGPGRGVEKAIGNLQRLPFVEYVEPDYVRRADTDDDYYGLQWGLENNGQSINGVDGIVDSDIDAELAWSITIGDPGLVVAVIDTGVDYSHEDLDSNTWVNSGEIAGNGIDDDSNGYIDDIYGFDFFSGDSDPKDEDGHGTHVAGTICAEGNNGIGVSGVAWECKIMALRFIGPDGGYTSDAIAALDYAVNMGVKLSNNSWGGGDYSQGLYDAISNAASKGHLFMAAAGNGGDDIIGDNTDTYPHYPSSYDLDNIISVASTDNQDQMAVSSNYGLTSVDVAGPGVDIASTMLGSYYWSSGTSMATPHVSGVAVLLLSIHPEWGDAEIKERILSTTRPIVALEGKTVTGGVLNAYNALQEPVNAPTQPSNLTATAVSHTQIDLTWLDTSDNANGFRFERSQDGGSTWSEIASVGAKVQTYSDGALDAETTYKYQIYAYNSAGNSGYSNPASATTDTAPSGQEVVASSEILGAGTVQGTNVDTWADDDISESITERNSGGRPSNRYSYLQHTWVFEVPVGSATLFLNGWSTDSVDEDSFVFSYSQDGNTYSEMFTIADGSSTSWHNYAFPPDTSGTIYVRVMDTDRTAGNLDLDIVTVDHMYIQSESEAGGPPVAPSGLIGSATIEGQIDLFWVDNATDEYGFEVERSPVDSGSWELLATLGADAQNFNDLSVGPETTYDYRVRAYNGAGYSSYSSRISVTSLTSIIPDLTLTATGYKVRGVHNVDLIWSGLTINVDIIRDGNPQTNVSGGTYTDANIGKGGASYTYQVCETETSVCSNQVVVTF